jgi:S1-C subfamily serine protease
MFASILFLGVALLTTGAQDQKKPEPLTEGEIVRLLQGGVAPQRVEDLAHDRGLSFEVTPAVERDLRDAGATDSLLQTLRQLSSKPAAPAVVLIVECTPGGAQVFVDDELIARASAEGRLKISTLTPGQHRLRLALEGYRDFEKTIDLSSTGPNKVTAALQADHIAPPPPPVPTTSQPTPKAYFGVLIKNLTPETAKLYMSPDTFGALVQRVDPQGPAAAAGLKSGDVVRSFNGEPLKSADDLVARVSAQEPGKEVGLQFLRYGNTKSVVVKLGVTPADMSKSVRVAQGTLRGLTFLELTDLWRKAMALPANMQGVVVRDVEPDTPAAKAGLVRSDVIEEVNRIKVSSLDDVPALAEKTQGDTLLLVNRQGKEMLITLSSQP